MEWKQERPTWCPHTDCVFQRRTMDALCGGELPKPEPHDGDYNTHRLCIKTDEVFDLQVNATDLGWLRWILDALDGESTSWLSRREAGALSEERVFPIQGGHPGVPWSAAEVAYESYAREFPGSARDQSLEMLAERGGFGLHEFACFYLRVNMRNDMMEQRICQALGKVAAAAWEGE